MGKAGRLYAVGDKYIIAVVNDRFTVVEQSEFLQAFLCRGDKVFLMCFTYIRNDTDGRGNDRAKVFHLVRLRNTCLENTQCILFAHLPDR